MPSRLTPLLLLWVMLLSWFLSGHLLQLTHSRRTEACSMYQTARHIDILRLHGKDVIRMLPSRRTTFILDKITQGTPLPRTLRISYILPTYTHRSTYEGHCLPEESWHGSCCITKKKRGMYTCDNLMSGFKLCVDINHVPWCQVA